MVEKVLKLGITVRKDARYVVYPGGVAMAFGNGTPEIIMWFTHEQTFRFKDSWDEYNYFIDQEGDLSREVKE
jgi:hypothetical protein